MKKIIVNEQVLKHILMEMTKEKFAINEAISVKDAYNRFYAGEIEREIYDAAMDGTANMTPFHKLLIDVIISTNETDKNMAKALALCGAGAWRQSDASKRQLMLRGAKSGELDTSSATAFVESLKNLLNTDTTSKKQMADSGLVTLYEDDAILVTCTLSYAASTKYYGMTSWCTASDIGGRYNGFYMFKRYVYSGNEEPVCVLVQVVVKNDKSQMVQFTVDRWAEIDEDCIMNREDESITPYMLQRMIKNAGSNLTVERLLSDNNWEELCTKCGECFEKETEYWKGKTAEMAKQVQAKIDKVIGHGSIISQYEETFIEEWDEYGIDFSDDGYGEDLDINANYIDDEKFSIYEIHGDSNYCVVVVGPISESFAWLDSVDDEIGVSTVSKRVFICVRENNRLRVIRELPNIYTSASGRGNICRIMSRKWAQYGDYSYYMVNLLTGEELPYIYAPVGALRGGYEFLRQTENPNIADIVDCRSVKKIGEIQAPPFFIWDDDVRVTTVDGQIVTIGDYLKQITGQ